MRNTRAVIYLATALAACGPKVVGLLPGDTASGGSGGSTDGPSLPGDAATGAPGSTGDPGTGDPGTGDPGGTSGGAIKPDVAVPDDQQPAVAQVAVHSVSACALLSNGAVRCWGYNDNGELGYGHTEWIGDNEVPAAAGDLPLSGPAIRVSVGAAHACAILEGGAVQCWGHGWDGSLGYGVLENVGDDETPAAVGFVEIGEPALEIASGWRHNCVILAGGRLRCWGENGSGELGYGHTQTIGDDEVPASAGDVQVGGEVVSLSLGLGTTCARLADGGLRCWGANHYGQIGLPGVDLGGDDELPASLPLVDVGGPILDVAAGANRTCALLASGAVRCFGENWYEGLGLGPLPADCTTDEFLDCTLDPLCCVGDDEVPSARPPVDVGAEVVAVSGGGLSTCALTATGGVRCWGTARFGIQGRGDGASWDCYPCNMDPKCCVGDDETPASLGDISLGGSVAAISLGQGTACARLVSGDVRCWGYGDHGELGLGMVGHVGDDELPSDLPPVQIVD